MRVRPLLSTLVRVLAAVLVGVAFAAGLAAFRGGEFGAEFKTSVWIVGCLMLLAAVFSVSPSTRHAQGELSNIVLGRRFLGSDDRGGASLTVVLAFGSFGMFAIALLAT